MKRKQSNTREVDLESRLMAVLASLFISVPTALFLWFGLNGVFGWFIGTPTLWLLIGGFSLAVFLAPGFLVSLLGTIWRAMLKIQKWLVW